jgi:hypothetical protein
MKKVLKFLIKNRAALGLDNDFLLSLADRANVASMARNKRTIAHELVAKNYVKALEALFNKSEDLSLDDEFWHATDTMGRTIGHEAILLLHDVMSCSALGNLPDRSHQLEMFNCLIKHSHHFSGEFWSLRDVNGETLGHLAVAVDSIQIITTLRELLSADYWWLTDNRGMTPVHTAVHHNRMNLFAFFIQNRDTFGFDKEFWSSITPEGYTLAHLAVNNPEVTNFFLLLENYKALGLDNSFWQIKNVAGNTIAHELFARNRGSAKFPVDEDESVAQDLYCHNKVLMLKRMLEESETLGLDAEFWRTVNNHNANLAHLAVNMHARMGLDALAYVHDKIELGDSFWYAQDKKGYSPIAAMMELDLATDQLKQGFRKKSHYYISTLLKLAKLFPLDKHLKYFMQSFGFEPLAMQYILSSELEALSKVSDSFPSALVSDISGYLYGSAVAGSTGTIYDSIVHDSIVQQNNDAKKERLPVPLRRLSMQLEVGKAIYKKLQSNMVYDSELVDMDKTSQNTLFPRVEPSKAARMLEDWRNFQNKLKISVYFENYIDVKNHELLDRIVQLYSEMALVNNAGVKRSRDEEEKSEISDEEKFDKRLKTSEGVSSDLSLMLKNKPIAKGEELEPNHQPLQLNAQALSLFLKLIEFLDPNPSKSPLVPDGYVDVRGDGLCFFHAIAVQLSGKNLTGKKLQQMAIDEVLNHPDRYGDFAHGGLEALLNYHLQRQESIKGGWADNIMMQALANALGYVVEVQLFDLHGNAIGADPVRIIPHHNLDEERVLRLGNIDNLHFVARANDNNLVEGHGIVNDNMSVADNSGSDGDNATLQEPQYIEFDADVIIGLASTSTNFIGE